MCEKEKRYMIWKKKTKEMIDLLINFNGISLHLGLFYA